MNYWHIQLHPNDNSTISKETVIDILKKKSIIGLGDWEEGANLIDQFINEMQIGDIVAVKDGGTPIALVKVKGPHWTENTPDESFDWFNHRREVEVLDFYQSDYDFIMPHQRGTLNICRDLSTATSQTIITWHKTYLSNKRKNDALLLLKNKGQIILEGPPGTGKTRKALQLAEILIKPRTLGTVDSIIDDIFKRFNPNDEQVRATRDHYEKLLNNFNTLFPKEQLNQLTLETYCAGKGDRDNFCWWLERGLKPLGYYFPGSARSYLIFWKKELDDYSKHGFVKSIEDDAEAMTQVAELIYKVVQKKDPESAVQFFGESFLLKLLNSYYPDEYFPINSERMIDNALNILHVKAQGLNVFEKNKRLNQAFLEKKKQFNSQINSFEFGRVLFDKFNIKSGESIDIKEEIVAGGEYKIIQFHPAYSYEDFVRGIVALPTESGGILYKVENKILAEFAQRAMDNPNGNYVLIIDEINRANLPAVLGELIYALEYRNTPVTSMYEYKEDRDIIIPENLYIIGTMNTADRSVSHIDYALRRRFPSIEVLPDATVIENEIALNLFYTVQTLFTNEHLSPDFNAKDVMIGHSYFLANNNEDIRLKLEYEIKPILREYLKDGILLDTAAEIIETLHV